MCLEKIKYDLSLTSRPVGVTLGNLNKEVIMDHRKLKERAVRISMISSLLHEKTNNQNEKYLLFKEVTSHGDKFFCWCLSHGTFAKTNRLKTEKTQHSVNILMIRDYKWKSTCFLLV